MGARSLIWPPLRPTSVLTNWTPVPTSYSIKFPPNPLPPKVSEMNTFLFAITRTRSLYC